MRIYVMENEKKKINIAIPTGMVMNRFTAHVAKKCIENHGQSDNVNISTSDISRLFHALKKFRKIHPELPLVQVESKDGTMVCIKL